MPGHFGFSASLKAESGGAAAKLGSSMCSDSRTPLAAAKSSGSSTETNQIGTPLAASLGATRESIGSSSRHGSQKLAQTLTTTPLCPPSRIFCSNVAPSIIAKAAPGVATGTAAGAASGTRSARGPNALALAKAALGVRRALLLREHAHTEAASSKDNSSGTERGNRHD